MNLNVLVRDVIAFQSIALKRTKSLRFKTNYWFEFTLSAASVRKPIDDAADLHIM